jgi:glycosyltransferase involved in cell wall biosynthesis
VDLAAEWPELIATTRTRVLALMEATSVTGPAKNLIGFCRWAHSPEGAGAGLQISIATYVRGADGAHQGFVDAARAAGITTYVIQERGRFDRSVFAQLAHIMAQAAPQLIQTHNSKSHLLLRHLKRPSTTPWIAFQHGYQDTDLKLHLYNQLDRWTLRAADRVVSVCQAFTGRLIAYGVRETRIRVLHNSVTPVAAVTQEAKAALKEQLGILADEAVILAIGRLSGEKGHADLIDALRHVPQASRPWKVIIVGDGPEKARLERLVAARGLTDRVVFAGFHPQVEAYYAIADVFVLPSHSEGSSNVLLEAMAARVPIAATSVGGTPEIVADGDTALLTAAGDSRGLGRSLQRLLTQQDLAAPLAERACARALTHFSPDRYRRALTEIYSDALVKDD